jgi:hypothetical protein
LPRAQGRAYVKDGGSGGPALTPAFKVSQKLRAKLPKEDRDKETLERKLWNKTGGRCFLCEDGINRASDDYEADHDQPEADAGETTIENLHLAHVACNRAKRAAGSQAIRPYLKFSRYLAHKGTRIKYDGALDFFEITPKATVISYSGDTVNLEFADQSSGVAQIMRETNEAGSFEFIYVEVPKVALFNDDDCQPRVIKKEQIAAIYSDIRRNPLHEPPSVRLSAPVGDGRPVELLMFDGQHKTIANWLMGRDRVVVKVYLNLSAEAAIELVNSIQAKIRKLPLSPFELASKLSEEWEDKLANYEKVVGEEHASEAGFIEWLPADDRPRAKQAFKAALVQRLLGNADLRLPNYAKSASGNATGIELTEQGIRSKIIERLVFTEPLREEGEALAAVRDLEASNIVRMLNHLTDKAFEPSGDSFTDLERERAKRMSYQQSLAYSATLLRDLWQNVAMKGGAGKFALADELSEEQWARITQGIDRLVEHPVWVTTFDEGPNRDGMQDLKIALEKNQQAQKAFEALALDLPYLLVDKYPKYVEVWESA